MTDTQRQLNAETLGIEVLDAMLYEVDKIPEWGAQPAHVREATRERLKTVAEKLVRASILCIIGESFPALPATLSGISFGDGIKATLKLSKEDPSRHDLADAVGTSVIIVISQPEAYLQRMDAVKVDPQQSLFAGIGETNGEIRASVANRSAQPAVEAACATCGHRWDSHADPTAWEHGDPTSCQSFESGGECPCDHFVPVEVAAQLEATKPDAEPETSTATVGKVDMDAFYAQICTCSHTRERHPLAADGYTDTCNVLGCPCVDFEEQRHAVAGPEPIADEMPVKPKNKAERNAALDAEHMEMVDITIVLRGTLAQIDIMITEVELARLTDEQRRAAYAYAARKQAYPQTKLPRPFFLPEPTPQP